MKSGYRWRRRSRTTRERDKQVLSPFAMALLSIWNLLAIHPMATHRLKRSNSANCCDMLISRVTQLVGVSANSSVIRRVYWNDRPRFTESFECAKDSISVLPKMYVRVCNKSRPLRTQSWSPQCQSHTGVLVWTRATFAWNSLSVLVLDGTRARSF